jgi:hypothetical protein
MRVRVVRFDSPGLIVRSRFGRPFTIAYGEIFHRRTAKARVGSPTTYADG